MKQTKNEKKGKLEKLLENKNIFSTEKLKNEVYKNWTAIFQAST